MTSNLRICHVKVLLEGRTGLSPPGLIAASTSIRCLLTITGQDSMMMTRTSGALKKKWSAGAEQQLGSPRLAVVKVL
jgi:hypothetical protein